MATVTTAVDMPQRTMAMRHTDMAMVTVRHTADMDMRRRPTGPTTAAITRRGAFITTVIMRHAELTFGVTTDIIDNSESVHLGARGNPAALPLVDPQLPTLFKPYWQVVGLSLLTQGGFPSRAGL
jgi:hypothetical protein